MTEQIHDTHTENPMFTNSTFPVFPIVKFKLPALLPKVNKRQVAGRSFPTFPTSERKAPFYPGEEPGVHKIDASVNTLDTIFFETMRRVQPSFPIHDLTQQKSFSALKTDSELMDRFIKELLTHNDLEVPRHCQNRILKLIVNHPDTTVKFNPFNMIISLREGYQYDCDCDSSLLTFNQLPVDDHLIERTLIKSHKPFEFQGHYLTQETISVDGQEIEKWSIPLTIEEADGILDRYRQKVE